MTSLALAVAALDQDVEQSRRLAERLQLPLSPLSELSADIYPYYLAYLNGALSCLQNGRKAAGPVTVDFTGGALDFRRQKGGGELIVKACGGGPQRRPSVLDVTAGLGRDSFILASHGYVVTAMERNPIVYELLADGMNRARAQLELEEVMARFKLLAGDAIVAMREGLPVAPDVIYIDPMFPPSNKSALVKKDMQAFHQLVGGDDDSEALLDAALRCAVYRVVVKRPRKASTLGKQKPSHTIEGKAIRFDVYTLKALPK